MSQYIIEANTMIFYDRSISDAIKSRKFFKCVDVFTSNVYANIIRSSTDILRIRVISLIFNERQILDIDLRQGHTVVDIEFHLLGYIVLGNGRGNSILEVMRPHANHAIELFINKVKTDVGTITNMLTDNRTQFDPIVQKKDNVGSIPFMKLNVLHSDIYAVNPHDETLLKLVDIYRPAELDTNFATPPLGSQARWFATGMPVDSNKNIYYGRLCYIQNPQILES